MSQDQPRDWDKELAEIDRLIAKAPSAKPGPNPASGSAPPALSAGSRAPAEARPAPAPLVGRRAKWGTWVRVGFGVAAGVALTQWPYARACGGGLFLYLGAVGAAFVAGGWAARAAWRHRMGAAHVTSLAVLLWSALLAAATVLPRLDSATGARWLCP